MYGRSFYDLDGHAWEVMWMDPPPSSEAAEFSHPQHQRRTGGTSAAVTLEEPITPSEEAAVLFRVRTTMSDRPGSLATLARHCGEQGVNILGLQIFPGVAGVTDELVLRAPDAVGDRSTSPS